MKRLVIEEAAATIAAALFGLVLGPIIRWVDESLSDWLADDEAEDAFYTRLRVIESAGTLPREER